MLCLFGTFFFSIVHACTEGLETIISLAKLIESQEGKSKHGIMLHIKQLLYLFL